MPKPTVPDRIELAPGLVGQPARHRPLAGRRHGAGRHAVSTSIAPPPTWRPMPRPASTRSTWPTTTAAPRTSPAASTGCCADGEVHTASRYAPAIFTKWCPTPGPMTPEIVRAAVDAGARSPGFGRRRSISCSSTGGCSSIPRWLDAMRSWRKLQRRRADRPSRHDQFRHRSSAPCWRHEGIPIATNQVCFSLLDRRAGEEMSALLRRRGREAARLRHARRRAPDGDDGWASPSRRRATSPTGAR